MVATLSGLSQITRMKREHWEEQRSLTTINRIEPNFQPISTMRLEPRAHNARQRRFVHDTCWFHTVKKTTAPVCAQTRRHLHTWTFNFLSLFLVSSTFFYPVRSLCLSLSLFPRVFLSLSLVYLVPIDDDGVSFKPSESLTRLKLVCETTVSLLVHAESMHRNTPREIEKEELSDDDKMKGTRANDSWVASRKCKRKRKTGRRCYFHTSVNGPPNEPHTGRVSSKLATSEFGISKAQLLPPIPAL